MKTITVSPVTFAFFFLFLLAITFPSYASKMAGVEIEKGVLDLRKCDIANKAIPLIGEWEFYWEEFIDTDNHSTVDQFDSKSSTSGKAGGLKDWNRSKRVRL